MAAADTKEQAREREAIATGCGLVDRSERGRLALSGPDAAEFLNGQVTNDVTALMPGSGCYAALLTHKGKMLADLRVIAPAQDARLPLPTRAELVLDTERVALQALFDTIRRHSVGYAVELHKLTLQSAELSLIGPRTDAVAGDALSAGIDLPAVEHSSRAGEIAGVPVLAVRTDLGIDVLCASPDAQTVAGALLAAGAEPVSDAAAEIVRVESGRPRYGVDLDDSVIPQEAGLNERAVSFTKGCYVGQETVARLYYKGRPNRQLRGLRLSAPAETGLELRAGDRIVGRLGSCVVSPRLGPIGLALVRREISPGEMVQVGRDGVAGEVTELPFSG